MAVPDEHSRRDFLQGKAAAHTLVDKARAWVDAKSELLSVELDAPSVLHVRICRQAMACQFALQFHEADREAPAAAMVALDLIEQLESQLTVYRDLSDVIEINRTASTQAVKVESGLFRLLELATRLNRETERAFDITSHPLSQVWGFLRRAGQLPHQADIDEALLKVGGEKVQLDPHKQTIQYLQDGVQINFNAIGKGYALDRAAEQLDSQGLRDYLWHAGGSSVLARGANRADDRGAWTVGLCHPDEPGQHIAEFHLRNQGLATAGGASQFFQHEGRRLSHVIDPRTGWPAEGVLSATVLAPSAAEADALATAFFVMGSAAVADYCDLHPKIGAVLVCPGEQSSRISVHAFGLTGDSWTPVG